MDHFAGKGSQKGADKNKKRAKKERNDKAYVAAPAGRLASAGFFCDDLRKNVIDGRDNSGRDSSRDQNPKFNAGVGAKARGHKARPCKRRPRQNRKESADKARQKQKASDYRKKNRWVKIHLPLFYGAFLSLSNQAYGMSRNAP